MLYLLSFFLNIPFKLYFIKKWVEIGQGRTEACPIPWNVESLPHPDRVHAPVA